MRSGFAYFRDDIDSSQRVLETKRYFRVCKDCGERNPVGWMCTDMGVCHECAERNHGIVF